MNDKDAKNAGRAYRLGRAFADGRRYSRRQLAEDAAEWITVKPNGQNGKGRPVLIDGETGKVLGGMIEQIPRNEVIRRALAQDASNKMSERAREVWRRNGAKLFAYLLGPNA